MSNRGNLFSDAIDTHYEERVYFDEKPEGWVSDEELDRELYDEQRSEARACGYEFPSYTEWKTGQSTRREMIQSAIAARWERGLGDLF